MEIIQHYAGVASAIVFLYCICFKKINNIIGKISSVKLVKIHVYSGIAAVILGIFHSYNTLLNNIVSFGTGLLILMIITSGTGILIKYSKGSRRNTFLHVHKICCIFCVLMLIFHVASYYIMEL